MREPSTTRYPLDMLVEDRRLAWSDGRVPVGPHDLRVLARVHAGRPTTSDLFLRAAWALQAGARTIAGIYFDQAAATLGIEHQTEASTAPAFV